MDIVKVLVKFYPNMIWSIGETYGSLIWNSEDLEKPSEELLMSLYNGVEMMRETRDKLLKEIDFRALPDFPNRSEWVIYRQKLRDLPEIWNGEYPTPPTL